MAEQKKKAQVKSNTPVKRTKPSSTVEVKKITKSVENIESNTKKVKFTYLKFIVFFSIFTTLIIITTIIEHNYSKTPLIELISVNVLLTGKNILEFYLMKLNETFTYTIIIPLSIFLTLSVSYWEIVKQIFFFIFKIVKTIFYCIKNLITKMINVIM